MGSQNNDIHVMSKSYAWRPLACLPILKNKLMEITDPTAQARRRLGLYHACLEHIIEQINALIKEPFYLRFADRKVRLCQAFYHFCSMDGEEVAATLMCSTSDCPVCECPKDELDRTDMFYPLRHTEEVKAAVYDARKELLEKDGTVKQGNKAKVSHTISHMLSHTISHHKDIAHDIASLSRYHIRYHIHYRTRYRIKDIT